MFLHALHTASNTDYFFVTKEAWTLGRTQADTFRDEIRQFLITTQVAASPNWDGALALVGGGGLSFCVLLEETLNQTLLFSLVLS